MKIGITGATGFVGRELVRQCLAGGHEVIGYSRSGPPDADFADSVKWRVFSTGKPLDVEGLDAIAHLAGESILGLWTDQKKKRIHDSRIDGTRRVVEGIAAATAPPSVLVCGSAIGFYGDTGEVEVTEATPKGKGFLAEVAADWEQEAARAEDTRVIFLRSGLVLGCGGGAMQLIGPAFRACLGGPLGNGRQWMSCIHVRDVAGIVLHAIEHPEVSGPLNAVLPEPVRNVDFTRAVAKAVHRPAVVPAPAFAIRLALGDLSHLLLDSQRVLPERTLGSGYQFEFRTLDAALAEVL